MRSNPLLPPRWPRRRRWLLVAVIFSGQLGLIFLLADHTPPHPRAISAAPTLQLAGEASAELLELSDPTLFALPHRQGFSGRAWLQIPPQKFPSFDWSEPPRWLALPVQQLGGAFHQFIETNQFDSFQRLAILAAELTKSEPTPALASSEPSRVRLAGGLAGRRLVTPLALPSWPHTDLLTNTIIKLVVNAAGEPVSPPLLLSGSGAKEADEQALKLARTARFEPIGAGGPRSANQPVAQLTWGEMIFEWQTVAGTNVAGTKARP
jgi:TonB family protein